MNIKHIQLFGPETYQFEKKCAPFSSAGGSVGLQTHTRQHICPQDQFFLLEESTLPEEDDYLHVSKNGISSG